MSSSNGRVCAGRRGREVVLRLFFYYLFTGLEVRLVKVG